MAVCLVAHPQNAKCYNGGERSNVPETFLFSLFRFKDINFFCGARMRTADLRFC